MISSVDPLDAKGLLKSAIRDDDPICIMESELMYALEIDTMTQGKRTYSFSRNTWETDYIEGEDQQELVPIGKAIVRRKGNDLTLVSFNKMMLETISAADALAKEGISAEVIDLRTIRPLDYETIVASVKKTNRLVVIDESWPFAGVSAEVAYEVQKYAFDYLDAPVIRVNSADTSLPYAPTLVDAYMPNAEKIVKAAKGVLYAQA